LGTQRYYKTAIFQIFSGAFFPPPGLSSPLCHQPLLAQPASPFTSVRSFLPSRILASLRGPLYTSTPIRRPALSDRPSQPHPSVHSISSSRLNPILSFGWGPILSTSQSRAGQHSQATGPVYSPRRPNAAASPGHQVKFL